MVRCRDKIIDVKEDVIGGDFKDVMICYVERSDPWEVSHQILRSELSPVPLQPCSAVVEHLLFFLNVPKLPSYFNANLRWQRVARLALSSKSWMLILLVQTWAIVCGNGPAETENEKLVEKVEEVLPEIGEQPKLTNCCRAGTKRGNQTCERWTALITGTRSSEMPSCYRKREVFGDIFLPRQNSREKISWQEAFGKTLRKKWNHGQEEIIVSVMAELYAPV